MSTDLIAFDATKLDLIKRTVAKGATDDELALFLHACKRTGLDPLMKQIHAIKRWSAADQREIMAIQTGIDGYRLIAERTGKYAGSDEPIFEEGQEYPIKASVTVWKLVEGQRMPFTASARWNEYVQKKKDGTVNAFWARMPYGQISKCAEALALRKAFPAELSGVYTHEEMMQADNPIVNKPLVNIPQVRPRTETVNEILSTDGTQPRHEDGAGHARHVVVDQQASDAPAPLSVKAHAEALAKAHNDDIEVIEGYLGHFTPYAGTKAFAKGYKPGLFDVEDAAGHILLQGVKYFDPDVDLTSGLKRISYRLELYKGKEQYTLVQIENV